MESYHNANWQLVPESVSDEIDNPYAYNSMILTQYPDMNRAWRKQNSPLLNLPAEIRGQIYSLVLRGKLRWNIRHTRTCEFCDRYGSSEDIPWTYPSWRCPCIRAHRTSLSLLMTCRQVNHEATPLWYQNNVMTFVLSSGGEKAINKLANMRPIITENIRYLSILSGVDNDQNATTIDSDAWEIILNCTKLETLELHPDNFIPRNASTINQLCSLPNFRALRVVSILTANNGGTIAIRVASQVPIPIETDVLVNFMDTYSRYVAQCYDALERQVWDFCEACSRSRRVNPPEYLCLEVDAETKQWVRVYGLPTTSLTRSRMKQAEHKEVTEERNAEQRERAKHEKQAAKDRQREREALDQMMEDISIKEAREQRTKQLVEMEKADAKKEKRKIKSNMKKQEETRRSERKRRPS